MIDLNNNSKEKGITLIALVITIIVLLILAGISITMITENNSILTRAGEAKNKTKETGIIENISLAYNSGKIEKYVGTKTLSEKMEEELAKIYGEDNVEVNDNGDNTYTVTINGEEYNIEDGKVSKYVYVEKKLVDLIQSSDYGKITNYSVTVDGDVLNNWKVFLNDGSKVYLIYGDYLESKYALVKGYISSVDGSKYSINASANYFVNALSNSNNWKRFAAGYDGATATGGPTLSQINLSLGRTNLSSIDSISGELYTPHNSVIEDCNGYWLVYETYSGDSFWIWYVKYDGRISHDGDGQVSPNKCLRPVVCLPNDAKGKVKGNSVQISQPE